LLSAFENAKKNNSRVHLLGVVSSTNVHSSFEHLEVLLKIAKESGGTAFIHAFTDGHDSPPKEAEKIIAKLENTIKEVGAGRLASISGRFYAMDRDENWERTERVFSLLTQGTKIMPSALSIIKEAYERDLTDEFIEPSFIGASGEESEFLLREGDSIIFFNFREDSSRQLAQAFSQEDFSFFPRPLNLASLFIITMTEYGEDLPVKVAFPKEEITEPLGLFLSKHGKRQLRLAESERASHVTFFFNGLRASPDPSEYWVIIPSPETLNFGEVPELSSKEITNRLIESMEEKIYDFILVNFANPDIIAHTGNYDATLKVVEIIDKVLNRISQVALKLKVPLLVTSDHGNIERMLDPMTGRYETKHDPSPVPFYLIDQRFFRERTLPEIEEGEKEIKGTLADVAPTVLELMGLEKPETMTGQSLLKYCK
jgi:2,3-bisphosphoglycerate-independent phosphoglycerate mutase